MKPLLVILSLLSTNAQAAEETLNLQGLSIVGDKELPKVLYIVPWKIHKPTKIKAPSYNSSLDDNFSFINKPNLE